MVQKWGHHHCILHSGISGIFGTPSTITSKANKMRSELNQTKTPNGPQGVVYPLINYLPAPISRPGASSSRMSAGGWPQSCIYFRTRRTKGQVPISFSLCIAYSTSRQLTFCISKITLFAWVSLLSSNSGLSKNATISLTYPYCFS